LRCTRNPRSNWGANAGEVGNLSETIFRKNSSKKGRKQEGGGAEQDAKFEGVYVQEWL